MNKLNFDFVEGKELTEAAQGLEQGKETSTAMVPAIVTIDSIKPIFLSHQESIGKWEAELQSFNVVGQESKDLCITIGAGAQKLKATIKNRRDEIWDPYLEFRKKLDGFVDGFITRLEKITFISKEKIKPYDALIEIERLKAEKAAKEATRQVQEKVNEEAAKLRVDPIQVQAPLIPEKPKKTRTASGFTGYEHRAWVFEVTDADKVRRFFLSPDRDKIQQAIVEGLREGMPDAEGLKIWEKVETRYR